MGPLAFPPSSSALGRGRPFPLFVSAAALERVCARPCRAPSGAGRPAGLAWAPWVTRDSPGPGGPCCFAVCPGARPRLLALCSRPAVLQSQGDASRLVGGCSRWAPGSFRLERLVPVRSMRGVRYVLQGMSKPTFMTVREFSVTQVVQTESCSFL